jgi:carbonic anhydrase/acetyltransferase-like protein (isoleucine patch superfamily)
MLYRFDRNEPETGHDTYVSELAHVIGNVVIGDNCYIGHGVILRGDYGRIEIGSGTAIEEGAVVHAPPDRTYRIGSHVTVGHGAVIHGSRIDDYAVIGMGAVCSLRSVIGEWSIVAEGSVVKMAQIVPAGVVVAGNPARTVRDVMDKDKEFWSYGKQVYVDLAGKYLELGMHRIG